VACHEHAFDWFGGVVKRVVIDNVKAGVLKTDLHDPVLGEPYRRLAQHYGFVASPNRPRTPRHKGKVESGVHYVKRNFIAGRTFADLESLNERGKRWVMETTGQRIHGTTKEAPLGRFHRQEQASLQALPVREFEWIATYQAKVQRDCHVNVESRYYSAPFRLIGKQVDVYVGRRLVEMYVGTELVATHPRVKEKGGRATRLEHYPEAKREWLANPPERCRERAQAIGNSCAKVVDALLDDPIQDRRRSAQSLLRWSETVSTERLENACRRALHYGDPSSRRVKKILDAGLDRVPIEREYPKGIPLASYRFARPASTFFGKEAPSC
jgi:hypothetical protein